MKNKPAGIIGTALGMTLASVAYCQLASSTTPPSHPSQPSKTSAAVTHAPLSYKIETYNSEAMGTKRSYAVALPPGYEQNLSQRYPVIFLLHGGHGDATDWFNPKKGAALGTIQQLYATGKLPPSIIITPDGNDRRGSSPYTEAGDRALQLLNFYILTDSILYEFGRTSSG